MREPDGPTGTVRCKCCKSVIELLREVREFRLSKVRAGETPIPLPEGAKLALHILPLAEPDLCRAYPLAQIDDREWAELARPLGSQGGYRRFNFDGLLSHGSVVNETTHSYVQVFRTGGIEAVRELPLVGGASGTPLIPCIAYEQRIIERVPDYLRLLKRLGVAAPLVAGLSLLGVRGVGMAVPNAWGRRSHLIEVEDVVVPETAPFDFGEEAVDVLRPRFDIVWNSTGWARSFNYDQDGKWGALENVR